MSPSPLSGMDWITQINHPYNSTVILKKKKLLMMLLLTEYENIGESLPFFPLCSVLLAAAIMSGMEAPSFLN